MSTEETNERTKGEEKIPLYFDRYVASELHALGQRITDLKLFMDERFTNMDERFASIDKRFASIDKRFASIDERFVTLKKSMEERFTQVDRRFDRRFDESREYVNMRFQEVNQRFDKLESTLKWAVGLLVPVIAGILAIIIKIFFSGKLSP